MSAFSILESLAPSCFFKNPSLENVTLFKKYTFFPLNEDGGFSHFIELVNFFTPSKTSACFETYTCSFLIPPYEYTVVYSIFSTSDIFLISIPIQSNLITNLSYIPISYGYCYIFYYILSLRC